MVAGLECQANAREREVIQEGVGRAWENRQVKGTLGGGVFGIRRGSIAAAVLVIGAVVWIGLVGDSNGPVYALEQTVEAVKDMRWFHFQYRPESDEPPGREAWVEYDEQGALKQVRVNFYGQNDVMVWRDGVTQLWDKDTNDLSIYEDLEYSEKIFMFAGRFDPKSAIEYLSQRGEQGGIHIDIVESAGVGESVEVHVDYDPNMYVIGYPKPRMRDVFRIDPETKLATDVRVSMYRDDRGGFVGVGGWEYLDYNEPFAEGLFELDDELPEDLARFDTLGVDLGLEQGALSDEAIVVKVVEAYLGAWKDKDYDRAARIRGYKKAGERKSTIQALEKMALLTVMEVREPSAAKRPLRGFNVVCKLEVERDSGVEVVECRVNVIRRTATRWRIGTLEIEE